MLREQWLLIEPNGIEILNHDKHHTTLLPLLIEPNGIEILRCVRTDISPIGF